MPTTVGMRFGRYELLEQIGAGGMGEVYRALDHDLHRDVAVKFLPERFASDPSRLARFAQEARTASSLNHPNIVTIHEIGQADGRPYIVMEYVDGETLRQLVQRGPLPIKQTLDLGVQLADGLAKAHGARIVHRDLKPENVMITRDGFAKILDFGLAKLRADADDTLGAEAARKAAEAPTALSPITAVGVLLGTAGYMSPEQARGHAADHRSDQFALGAMLYEMATGRRAFHRESVVQTLSAIIDTEPRPIPTLNPSFPAPARWVIERCLAKDPAGRYESTQDLAQELRGVREHISEASSPPLLRQVVARPLRSNRWLHFTVGVAVVLAILFLTPIRDGLVRLIRPAPLSDDVRLAVLVNDSALPRGDRDRLTGLHDYIVIRLADLKRFRQTLSVVPSSELREALVRSPGDAKRRVGASLAVSLNMHRLDDDLVVSVSLEDTDPVRVIGGDQRRFRLDQVSGEEIVDVIVGLLQVQLASHERSAWTTGSSSVAEARTLFARGLVRTPYQTAQSALEKYDQEQSLQAAIDDYNRAIELDPRYADAYAKLGEAYLWLYRLTRRQEHIGLAAQNATKARELDDTRPSTWITLGMIHGQKGEYAEAEAAFENALVRGPRTVLAYRELARVQQRAGDLEKAEANYRKAIELDPEGWANYSHLAAFLAASNRLAEAEEMFVTATRKAPENARAWSNLGGLYYLQRKFDEAEHALERANGLYDYGPALSNLATIKFRVRGQYAEAAALLERAAKVAPRDYRIARNLAAAYYWTPGERHRAAEPLNQALAILGEARRIEPDNPEVLAELADTYAMRRDAENALPLIARALKLAPSNATVAGLAAAVYETLGNRDAALEQVAAALRAGGDRFEFESDPTFESLVTDPRYAALVKSVQPR